MGLPIQPPIEGALMGRRAPGETPVGLCPAAATVDGGAKVAGVAG